MFNGSVGEAHYIPQNNNDSGNQQQRPFPIPLQMQQASVAFQQEPPFVPHQQQFQYRFGMPQFQYRFGMPQYHQANYVPTQQAPYFVQSPFDANVALPPTRMVKKSRALTITSVLQPPTKVLQTHL